MSDYQERTVVCGQIKINYAQWHGDGPPLLLVHGLSGRWQSWLNVIPLLRPRWRVTALDLRGHGRSGRAADGYDLRLYAADVESFIPAVIGGPVNVIGHSLGAMTAIVLASNAPSLVRSAVLEDPPVYAYRRSREGVDARFGLTYEMASSTLPLAEIARRIVKERPETTPEQAAGMAENWRALDPRTVGGVIDGSNMWGDWIEDSLRRVHCPTLLLEANAELGGALKDTEGPQVASLMSKCTLVRWPDTGHGMHAAKPEQFVAAAEARFKAV